MGKQFGQFMLHEDRSLDDSDYFALAESVTRAECAEFQERTGRCLGEPQILHQVHVPLFDPVTHEFVRYVDSMGWKASELE